MLKLTAAWQDAVLAWPQRVAQVAGSTTGRASFWPRDISSGDTHTQ